jgi:hypothetical protein
MSLAGRRSNRGDAYQTQIAVDWAISMLADPKIQSVETDATMMTGAGPVPVDDILIATGLSRTYCQCKKNEPDFKDWTVATLSDELAKAARLVMSDPSARICFYSRSGFASLAKLREYAVTVGGAAAYRHGLGAENATVDAALNALFEKLNSPADFTFDFLCRTTFQPTPEFQPMESLQLERLRNLVAQAPLALDTLWVAFDRASAGLGIGAGSTATPMSLSREMLLERLREVGATVSAPRSQQDAEQALQALSGVGREWRRDIDGLRLRRICSDALLRSIESGAGSILVTGGPGSGKSCVLLDLAEDLANSRAFPVYVQCRVFAEAEDAAQREVLGMPSDLVGLVARLAEYRPIAVLFDSLDVLSLSREHAALNHCLAAIDRLLNIPDVTVVAACRSFDAKYDRRLSVRDWNLKVDIPDLHWEDEIVPLLRRSNVDEGALQSPTRSLIGNARHLAMFLEICKRGHRVVARTHQELTREFLDATVRSVPGLGDGAERQLESIAEDMLKRKSLEIGPERANLPSAVEALLLSGGVLQRTGRRTLEFTHQTLLDVLAIASWERQGGSLESFTKALPPVPFVRPAVRAYALHVAAIDRRVLRAATRAIVSSGLPHHLRRLVVETLADLEPLDEDLPLVNWLRGQGGLFESLFDKADSLAWHRFWLRHLAPIWHEERDQGRILYLATRAGRFLAEDTDGVLAFWNQALDADWVDLPRVAMNISFSIGDYKGSAHLGIGALAERLLALPKLDHDALGAAVLQTVRSESAGPEFIWAYITSNLDDDSIRQHRLDDKLRCEACLFEEGGVLTRYFEESIGLLSLAMRDVRRWRELQEEAYASEAEWTDGFLGDTSHSQHHSRHDISHSTSLTTVLRAMEAAVLKHAREDSDWWRQNKAAMASSRDGALRYWAVRALTANPELDLALAVKLSSEQEMLTYSLSHEVGDLVNAVVPLLDPDAQDVVLSAIAALPGGDFYLLRHKCAMAAAIPAPFRPAGLVQLLEAYERKEGWCVREPHIHSMSGTVTAPFPFQRFLDADDLMVLRLLQHYRSAAGSIRDWGDLVGGAEHVGRQLGEAASRAPIRFLRFLSSHWAAVPDVFRGDILDGCSQHAEHLFGSHGYNKDVWNPVEHPDAETLVAGFLDEIERHPAFWSLSRAAARALNIVAEMATPASAERVAFHLLGFFRSPAPRRLRNLIDGGMNSTRGMVAEAAVRMAVACQANRAEMPPMLRAVVRLLARDDSPEVRAMIVHHLPYFISRKIEFGWELFALAMEGASIELWRVAESCLYWAYHAQHERTAPYMEILLTKALEEAGANTENVSKEDDRSGLSGWARIATLSSLSGHVSLETHLQRLNSIDRPRAWRAAAAVWGVNATKLAHRAACLAGLGSAMKAPAAGRGAVSAMDHVFRARPPIAVPEKMVVEMFRVEMEAQADRAHYHPHFFTGWLESMSLIWPDQALAPLEQLANFLKKSRRQLYDNGPIARTLTALCREAEEREQSDQRAMLDWVVRIQDQLLVVGVHGLDDWLRAAERP